MSGGGGARAGGRKRVGTPLVAGSKGQDRMLRHFRETGVPPLPPFKEMPAYPPPPLCLSCGLGGSAFEEGSGLDNMSCCDSEEAFSADVSDTRRVPRNTSVGGESDTDNRVKVSARTSVPQGKDSVERRPCRLTCPNVPAPSCNGGQFGWRLTAPCWDAHGQCVPRLRGVLPKHS